MTSQNSTLAHWLDQQFLEWRATQDRKHGSLTAFANYLGIKEELLNLFVNGRRTSMSQVTADRIADKLGDEIYDLVDLPRPDPYLRRVVRVWHRVSESRKKYIVELAEKEAGKDESLAAPAESRVARPKR